MLSDFFFRVRCLFRRNVVETELADELRFHYEQQLAKYMRSGLSEGEALRRIRMSFGGLGQVKEECQDAWGTRLLETLLQDLRYGSRWTEKTDLLEPAGVWITNKSSVHERGDRGDTVAVGRLGANVQRPYGEWGAVVFLKGDKLNAEPKIQLDYAPLVQAIVGFFQTKKPPVPNEVTLEIFAFMDAAQRSEAAGGKAMALVQ